VSWQPVDGGRADVAKELFYLGAKSQLPAPFQYLDELHQKRG